MSQRCFLATMQGVLTLHSQIDFAHSTTGDLESLSQACQPASFGLNNKDVLDETYRRAGKLDLDAFATLFDPRSLGVHAAIEHDLLASDQTVEFELSKLNVYGKSSLVDWLVPRSRANQVFREGRFLQISPRHSPRRQHVRLVSCPLPSLS